MNRHFLMASAKARATVTLVDGKTVVLVGIPKRAGQRARVRYDTGRIRTIPLANITHIEGQER